LLFAADIPSRPDIRPFDDKTNAVNITGQFGERRGTYSHNGTDYALRARTTVNATADGVVIACRWFAGYGFTVIIDHGTGLQTLYGHLDEPLCLRGFRVRKGEPIALSGNTGTTTGAHLHYEMRQSGRAIWPGTYQRQRGIEEGRIKP
jgi:murein DD-endopeptidase MepM/ murein hydrolase activator NlpD